MQPFKKITQKSWFNLLLSATFLIILAGCTPLQPDAAMIEPAVSTENGTDAAADQGDAMEMGAAMATITTPALVLRQSPDEASDALQTLAEGDVYKVIGISPDGTWVRLETDAPAGSGWAPARSVTVKGDITDVAITDDGGEVAVRPTPAPGGVVVRTDGTRLRVRAEPSTDAEIAGYVYDGEAYNVLETTADGSWARLDVADVAEGGWVSTEFLTFPGDAVPAQPVEEAVAEEAVAEEAVAEETVAEEVPAEEAAAEEAPAEETVAEEVPAEDVAESEDEAAPAEEATTGEATETAEASEPAAEEATGETEASAPTSESAEAETPADEAAEATAVPEPETSPEADATPAPEAEPVDDGELPTPNPGEAIIYTDGTRLRVRSEPTTESELVGHVQNGEVYTVLETSPDGLWVKLDIPEIEGGGWVADIYVLTAQ